MQHVLLLFSSGGTPVTPVSSSTPVFGGGTALFGGGTAGFGSSSTPPFGSPFGTGFGSSFGSSSPFGSRFPVAGFGTVPGFSHA
ncbi:unnamed protein product, partial [Rotaria sp. Silwood1]